LLGALQAADFQVELITPSRLPSDLPSLAQYDSIVLVDVPARGPGAVRCRPGLRVVARIGLSASATRHVRPR